MNDWPSGTQRTQAVTKHRTALIHEYTVADIFQPGQIKPQDPALILPFYFQRQEDQTAITETVTLPHGLTIIAAHSSSGKTAMLSTLCAHIARNKPGAPVLYITAEEARHYVWAKLAGAMWCAGDGAQWTTKDALGYMTHGDLPRMQDGSQKDLIAIPRNICVWEVHDTPFSELIAQLDTIPITDTPVAVFVDCLHSLRLEQKERRDMELEQAAVDLRLWAQARECAIVVTVQAGCENIATEPPPELTKLTEISSITEAFNALRENAGIQLHQLCEGTVEYIADMVLAIQYFKHDALPEQRGIVEGIVGDAAEAVVLKDRYGDGFNLVAPLTLRGECAQFVQRDEAT